MEKRWTQLEFPTAIEYDELADELRCGTCGWPVEDTGSRNPAAGLLSECDLAGCPHSTAPTTTAMEIDIRPVE